MTPWAKSNLVSGATVHWEVFSKPSIPLRSMRFKHFKDIQRSEEKLCLAKKCAEHEDLSLPSGSAMGQYQVEFTGEK
ncbi:hypothetical protein KIN20_020735 [Parelaphostrongylus tenuis]|uniref:Uncharacterized protein n=1 Tax=Parelaphostrongylus tenuis TaxID=148309 RepID=A0AAD5N4G0_PARTN|nr:hypothetical protein KIN20_020735 [Parelaphostrongylus tenuis]